MEPETVSKIKPSRDFNHRWKYKPAITYLLVVFSFSSIIFWRIRRNNILYGSNKYDSGGSLSIYKRSKPLFIVFKQNVLKIMLLFVRFLPLNFTIQYKHHFYTQSISLKYFFKSLGA